MSIEDAILLLADELAIPHDGIRAHKVTCGKCDAFVIVAVNERVKDLERLWSGAFPNLLPEDEAA